MYLGLYQDYSYLMALWLRASPLVPLDALLLFVLLLPLGSWLFGLNYIYLLFWFFFFPFLVGWVGVTISYCDFAETSWLS